MSLITFDAARHEYRTTDGRLVPSVTQILHATGIATDFEALAARSSRIAEAIEYRRALGVAAHADCHAYDDDALDWNAVDDRVLPYVKAWTVFREQTGLAPIARERRLFHPGLFYAGTLDGVFERFKSELILVDVKLGDPEDAGAQWQTAAYAEFLALALATAQPGFDAFKFRLQPRYGVQLLPTGKAHQTKYTNQPGDWRDFCHMVTTFRRQHCRRTGRER